MKERGKSELLGFDYRLVGFLYQDHPLGEGKIQITFFEQMESLEQRWLFCFSDVSRRQMRVFKRELKRKLGTIVGSEEVIPYVQRSVEGATYAQLKEIITKAFDEQVKWWNE